MQGDRGLGLSAHIIDHCNLILKFPQGTNSTWVMFTLVSGFFLRFQLMQVSHSYSYLSMTVQCTV